jgi:putative transposon-encoded protein
MIEQLRTEKELLQSELAAVIAQLGTPLGNSTKTSVWKSKQSESIEYIQKRLFEFNCKIDDIIVKNRQIGNREFGANRENVNMELRQSTIREHEEQINSLKSQVQ